MRALTIDAHGWLEQVRYRDDLPEPVVEARDHVRVRMLAAALNHVDLWTIRGTPSSRITPAWIIGGDGVGIVDDAGPGVTSVKPGDTVFLNPGVSCGVCEYCTTGDNPLCLHYALLGEHRPGTMAEFVVVPERNVRSIPVDSVHEVAAAYPLATLTAWRICVSKAKVREGDEVLIWGIGGGVAQAALRICLQRGARTWVTSGSDEKLERAAAMGAHAMMRHGEGMDIGREVRARTGKRGVDVVIDSVGSATWRQSLGALGRGGRLVTCGGTSGHMLETDVRRLFWNQWTIMGSTMGSDSEFDAITAEFAAGRLTATVDSVFPLERGVEAVERLASGTQFGKVVVRIS